MSADCSRTSATSRDLPIPVSPTSSTRLPNPARAGASDAPRIASSRTRSTSGRWRGAGAERAGVEARPGPLEHRRGDEDLAGLRARHQPRGERRGVAEDRVRAAERRAHLAGEDAAAVHAGGDRERRPRVEDRADGEEQAVLVLARRLRRARDEDDPPAVAVDVALEERHLVLVARGLHRGDELVHGGSGGVDPLAVEQAREPAEAQERDRRLAVLRLDHPGGHRGAHGGGHADRQVEPVDRREQLALHLGRRLEPQEHAAALRVAELARLEGDRGRAREQDVAGLGRVLELDRPPGLGPADDQLAVGRAREEEVEVAAVQADVHAQRHLPDGRVRPADRAQHPAHPVRRARAAPLVPRAREEEQEGVAAELQEAAAVRVRDVEQMPEGRVHDLVHLLRASLALSRQTLGHRGEAGDVDEGHRPLDLAREGLRRGAQPLDRQPRDVGRQLRAGDGRNGHPVILARGVDIPAESGHNCLNPRRGGGGRGSPTARGHSAV
jgi:hypothetical protein